MKPDVALERYTWQLVALHEFYCGITSSRPETTNKNTQTQTDRPGGGGGVSKNDGKNTSLWFAT